jgi:hypothetical protein
LAFFVVTGDSFNRSERAEFGTLIGHLQKHPSDWKRHCFLVHEDVPFTTLTYGSQVTGKAPPPLRVAVWKSAPEAERVAEDVAKFWQAGAPSSTSGAKSSESNASTKTRRRK